MSSFGMKIEQFDLPMQFNAKLKTIKGVNVKEQDIYLEIDFFSLEKIKTQTIYNTDKPKWVINKKLNITINKLSDFNRILNIKIFTKRSKYLGNVELTFYEAIMGTVRNNFVINSKSRYLGRLQFDLKVSQIIQMNIKIEKLKAEIFDFQSKFTDKQFENFNFQVYLDTDSSINSGSINFHSYIKNIKSGIFHNIRDSIDEYEFNWISQQFQSSNYHIEYSDKESEVIAEEIMTLDETNTKKMLNISSSDDEDRKKVGSHTSFRENLLHEVDDIDELTNNHFMITKTNGPTQILNNKQEDSIGLDFYLRTNKFPYTHLVFKVYDVKTICAVGYLPLDNYFHHMGNFIEKTKESYLSTGFNIWKYGHFKGSIDLFLKFNFPTFFRQKRVGIRTEDGVFSSSNVIKFTERSVVNESKIIKMFKDYKTELDSILFKTYNIQEEESNDEDESEFVIFSKLNKDLEEHFHEEDKIMCREEEIYRFQKSILELYVC